MKFRTVVSPIKIRFFLRLPLLYRSSSIIAIDTLDYIPSISNLLCSWKLDELEIRVAFPSPRPPPIKTENLINLNYIFNY
jgi:hypothetical protein